jgi:flavin-dependent dehydrogenase
MKTTIVGSGIAGNVVAHYLRREHDISVFEAASHIGGHRLSAPGSRGLYVHAYLGLLPPRAVDMLTVSFGQLMVRGRSPLKIRSLVGCSPTPR